MVVQTDVLKKGTMEDVLHERGPHIRVVSIAIRKHKKKPILGYATNSDSNMDDYLVGIHTVEDHVLILTR